MASAVLPSRNEQKWSDHGGYMSKFTNNSNPNFTRFNTNPNPSRLFTSRDVIWRNHNHEQLPSSAHPPPSEAVFTGSSVNSVPANSIGHRYITYRLGSYTRRELEELKKRLISDLDRVRTLRRRICSPPIPKQDYHPPEPVLLPAPEVKSSQKRAISQKRTAPFPSVRDTKKKCGGVKNNAQMRKCGQILAKLMKHKHGWVFNTPVDAAAMRLYDYHSIIKNPMDLGTIKSKFAKNEYESPLAFASDVRLTFQNAMAYNGEGSDVFVMAELLLSLFEDMFNSAYQKLAGNQIKKQNCSVKVPILVEKPVSNVTRLNSMDANLGKAVDRIVNKPEMMAGEKADLAARLSNLQMGPEGMDQIMAIVKKGVLGLAREGDEIELDLEVLDNETLWELDSFIRSSNKKAEGMITNLVSPVQANNSEHLLEEQGKKRDEGEEDVDIGEEIPVTNFSFVEIEKDAVNVGSSSSSSSSGSDSSSSDSDSGSSSGDDSNEEKGNPTPKGGSMGI